MFREMGEVSGDDVARLEAAVLSEVALLIKSGEYMGWLAHIDGRVVAGAGAMLRRLLPRGNQFGFRQEAYVLNVFTEAEYRSRGIAHAVLEELIAWAREQGCVRITLHASDAGRRVYERLGFEDTNEMRLKM